MHSKLGAMALTATVFGSVSFCVLNAAVALADSATIDKAYAYYQGGNLARAQSLLEKALDAIDGGELSDKYLARCLRPLIDIYHRQSDFKQALAVGVRYRKAVEQSALDGVARRQVLFENSVQLAELLIALNRHAEAEKYLQDAVRALPANGNSRPKARLALKVRLAQAAEGQADLTKVAQRWNDVVAYAQQLLTDLDAKKLDEGLLPEVAAALKTAYLAEENYAQAIDIEKRLLKRHAAQNNRDAYIGSCLEIATLYARMRQFERAKKYLHGGLTVSSGERSVQVAMLSAALAEIDRAEGRESDARRYWQQAVTVYEQVLGSADDVTGDVNMTLVVLGKLQTAYEQLGRHRDAIRIAEKLLALRRAELGENDRLTMAAQSRLGALYGLAGEFEKARPLLLDAAQYWKKLDPPAPLELATVVNDLAVTERATGSYDQAQMLFEKALSIRQRQLPSDDMRVAYSYSNLASVLSPRGDYARAIVLYEQALEIFRKKGQVARSALSNTLLNMAMTYKSQGQLDKASEYCQDALAVHEQTFGKNAPGSVALHNALTALAIGRESLAEAATHNRRALEICQQHDMGAEPVMATALHQKATLAFIKHDWMEASQSWHTALKIQEAAGLVAQQARTLNYLAKTASLQNDHTLAESLYRRALALQEITGAYPALQYLTHCNLAEILDARGQTAEARQLLEDAVLMLEAPRAGTVGAEVERAKNFARFADAFDLLVTWSLRDGKPDEALRYAERARNRTFLDQLNLAGVDLRETLHDAAGQRLRNKERELRSEFGTLRARALDMASDGADPADLDKLSQQLKTTQAEYAEVSVEIRNASQFYRESLAANIQVGVESVRPRLIDSNRLMLFYVLRANGSDLLILGDTKQDVHRIPLHIPDSLAAAMSVPAGPLTRRLAMNLISQYMQDLRERAGGRGLGGVVTSPKGVLAADHGIHLAEVILPREARDLVLQLAPRGVIIVPDGALHQLPFEALLLSNQPQPRYLLDVFPPINYAPSVAILMNLQQRAGRNHDTPPSVLTVGNPQYAQQVEVAQVPGVAKVSRAAFLGLGGDLAALPGTAAECRRVAKAFSSLPVTLLSGPDATEDNVRKHIGGRRFVHLAAHGLVDQQYDNCFGAIALTPPQVRGNLAENDGFLELREIQTLPLSDCELAVLSACQTVVGPNRPQEAGSSLAQAFLIAGARRVICSHWNVDDASTSEMMGIFFEHVAGMLERGERIDYAAALRAAQETLRAKSDHASPYYWAPFVLVGPAT